MKLLDDLRAWWTGGETRDVERPLVTKACLHGAHRDRCDLPEHCECACHARDVCGEEFYGWAAPGEMVMDFSVPRHCNLPYPHAGADHNYVREPNP